VAAVGGIVAACVARKLPLVVATTGLEDRERQAIAEAAREIPILQSPSMSLAVNIAMDLVGRAGGLLARVGGRTDVEIIECHHRHKEDSPSGTALKFGAIVREQMRQTREVHGRAGRPGAAARAQGAALRIYFSQRRRRTTDAFARERIIRDELAVSHPCRPRRSRRQAGCEGHEVGR
jgi:4-hydroxy-tetrahydrodipicolinate reductase